MRIWKNMKYMCEVRLPRNLIQGVLWYLVSKGSEKTIHTGGKIIIIPVKALNFQLGQSLMQIMIKSIID